VKHSKLILFSLSLLILFTACRSTTYIYSSVPDSKVYIGDEYKGKTPYKHSDRLPTGFKKKVRIEKDGYEPVEQKIRKFERVNGIALISGLLFLAPLLWVGTYNEMYCFEMTPSNGDPIKSDYIEFGPEFKTNSKFGTPLYLGEQDKNITVYIGGSIYTLDEDMNLLSERELLEDPKENPLDGYVNQGKVRIVEYDKENKTLAIHTAESSGNIKTSEFSNIIYYEGIFDTKYSHGYDRNKVSNNFIVYSKKSILGYDENVDQMFEYETNENIVLHAELLSDDSVVSLEYDGNDFFVVIRKKGNEETIPVEFEQNCLPGNVRVNADESTNRVFVSALTYDRGEEEVNGYEIHTFDLNSGRLQEKCQQFFDEKTNETLSNEYLINKGIKVEGSNVYFSCEEQLLRRTHYEKSGGNIDKYGTNNVLIVNAKEPRDPYERIIEKRAQTFTHASEKLTYQLIPKDDELYMIYNSQLNGRYLVYQTVFDNKLEVISRNVKNTYKEKKTIFDPFKSFETETGELFMFHQYKKKLGGVRVDF